jgi:hypothetical protein
MPSAPTFDADLSNRFQNVLSWVDGVSLDIEVTGYQLFSDYGLPGNMFLVYDGTQNTQKLAFIHEGLVAGTEYNY